MAFKASGVCGVCGVPSTLRCAGCRKVRYCTKEHQIQDWPQHKADCAEIKAACASTQHKAEGAHAGHKADDGAEIKAACAELTADGAHAEHNADCAELKADGAEFKACASTQLKADCAEIKADCAAQHETYSGLRQPTPEEEHGFIAWLSRHSGLAVTRVVYSSQVMNGELVQALTDMGKKSRRGQVSLQQLLSMVVRNDGAMDCAVACLLFFFYSHQKTASDLVSFAFPPKSDSTRMIFLTTNALHELSEDGEIARFAFGGQWICAVGGASLGDATEFWGMHHSGLKIARRKDWGANLVALHSRLLLSRDETMRVMYEAIPDYKQARVEWYARHGKPYCEDVVVTRANLLHSFVKRFVSQGKRIEVLYM